MARSIRSFTRFKLTGEGEPATQAQTLSTKVSLFNILRLGEKTDLAKLTGDLDQSTVSSIVETALNSYFESLPGPEQEIIDRNATSTVEFLVRSQELRDKLIEPK